MAGTTRIGIIGDFNERNPTHVATNSSIAQAAEVVGREIEVVWLPTDETHDFRKLSALFCSPGSPYKSLEGALRGIQHARENDVPFIGTCGGFQHLVLEFARNVMGIEDAAHAESDPYASRLFITPLSCSLVGKMMEVCVRPGSKAAAIYQSTRSTEAYYCNFGLNPEYRESLEQAGLTITGVDQDGEARIAEIGSHRFFMGTLFVPQARMTGEQPHPLIMAFCRAALEN